MNGFYSLWDTYIFEHDFLNDVIFSFYEYMNFLFIAHWFYKHISFSPWRAIKKKGQQAEAK